MRKSSRRYGAWLTTGAVVLTVRCTAAGRGWWCSDCRWDLEGKVGGIPLGLPLSPSGPVGAWPASLSLSALHGALTTFHMTAQKTTSCWLYSPSFVHFEHRDTRQIMLNDRRRLPQQWLLCCQSQVCKCQGATLHSFPVVLSRCSFCSWNKQAGPGLCLWATHRSHFENLKSLSQNF